MLSEKALRNHPVRKFLESHVGVIGALLVIGIAAYGIQAFNLLIVGDDWLHTLLPHERCRVALSVGRWTKTLIWHLTSHQVFAPSFTLMLTLVCWAIAGIFLSITFGAKTKLEKFLGASLLLVNPILATHVIFPSSHLAMSLGMLCAGMSVYYANRTTESHLRKDRRSRLINLSLSGLCLAIAFGVRPSLFLFTAVAMFASTLSRFTRSMENPSSVSASTGTSLMNQCLCLFTGGLLWLIIWKSLQTIFNIESYPVPGYAFLPSLISTAEDLRRTSLRFLDHLSEYLFLGQHLWAFSIKLAFLIILFLYIGAVGSLILRHRSKTSKKKNTMIFLFLMVLLFSTPWFIGLIRIPWNSYRYTARLGLIPIYAFFAIQTLRYFRRSRAYAVVAVISLFIVLSFTKTQSQIAITIKTRNARTAQMTSSLLQRIESHPRFSKLKKNYSIFLIGEKQTFWSGEPLFSMGEDPSRVESIIEYSHFDKFFAQRARLVTMQFEGKNRFHIVHRGLSNLPRSEQWALFKASRKALKDRRAESIQIENGDAYIFFSRPQWLVSMVKDRFASLTPAAK